MHTKPFVPRVNQMLSLSSPQKQINFTGVKVGRENKAKLTELIGVCGSNLTCQSAGGWRQPAGEEDEGETEPSRHRSSGRYEAVRALLGKISGLSAARLHQHISAAVRQSLCRDFGRCSSNTTANSNRNQTKPDLGRFGSSFAGKFLFAVIPLKR